MTFDEWMNKYYPEIEDKEIRLKMSHSWTSGQVNLIIDDDFFDRWWIDVNDRLPEEEGYYWVQIKDSPHSLLNKHTVLFKDNKFISAFGITHWRPLPSSPSKK